MTQPGTLAVRVYTSRAQIPVVGAAVAITRPVREGKHDLIFLGETDESGRIPPVVIAAPPATESLSPGTPHPYATCDVWVEHPVYDLLHVENVQIFSGVGTVQNAELIPLPQHAPPQDMVETVDITPQPL